MKTSIIVTSYNYGRYVERCLRSCLNQQHVGDSNEVILVDDASQDNTLEIVEKFNRHPNFRVIVNPQNVGVAEAANAGIRAALGQFVVRVDADDYIGDLFAFFLRSYLEVNHDAFGVACDYVLVDEHENAIERVDASARPISCGIMYRRDLLVEAGLYNHEFRHLEEQELRRRLGEYYRIHYLHMPFYRYRMHNNNKTKQEEYKLFHARLEQMYAPSEPPASSGL